MTTAPQIIPDPGAVALREDHAAAAARYVQADKAEATKGGYPPRGGPPCYP